MNVETFDNLPLVVVGYDFRRASTRWRSMLVMKMSEQDALSERLEASGMATGLVVLGTCNRNELIASTATPEWTGEILRAQMMRRLKEKSGETRVPEPYVHVGAAAVRHMLRVAAGLESFVMGERQIASQLNCALDTARKRKHSSVILNGLGTFCGRASREAVKAHLGEGGVRGVHDAAVRFLEMHKDASKNEQVLVVGTGEIGRRVIQSLHARTNWTVRVANRTRAIVGRDAARALDELPDLLAETSMAIVCTGALDPLITPAAFAKCPPDEARLVLDLGIPAQVAPEVNALQAVEAVNLDGLVAAGLVNTASSEMLMQLDTMIANLEAEFERFCRERDLVTILRTTQRQHERYVNEIIPRFIDDELPALSPEERGRVAFKLRGLIREYTNTIFNSIHEASDDERDNSN